LMPPIIPPGKSFTYKFKVTRPGTYWYHADRCLQEQRGMYGPLIVYPKKGEDRVKVDRDYSVVLSDWSNEDAWRILMHLRKFNHYYSLKRGAVQSWYKVIKQGRQAVKDKVHTSFKRIDSEDIS